MSLITQLLQKRGIKDTSTLSTEERETINRWESVFKESEITVDKIEKFCDLQISLVERQFGNLDNTTQKNNRLVLLYTVYSNIKRLISSPKAEKASLEEFLRQQILDSGNKDEV